MALLADSKTNSQALRLLLEEMVAMGDGEPCMLLEDRRSFLPTGIQLQSFQQFEDKWLHEDKCSHLVQGD